MTLAIVTLIYLIYSFLKILQVVVQDASTSFRCLLPKIISICMEHIYPLVAPVSTYTCVYISLPLTVLPVCKPPADFITCLEAHTRHQAASL